MIWQEIAVIVAVVLALTYLGFYFWRRRKKKHPCDSCPAAQRMQRFETTDSDHKAAV